MYYAIGWYSKLAGMTRDKIKKIAEEAGELSQKYPLQMMHDNQFSIAEFDDLSGLQCVSLLAVAVDLLSDGQISERELAFREWLLVAKQMSTQH